MVKEPIVRTCPGVRKLTNPDSDPLLSTLPRSKPPAPVRAPSARQVAGTLAEARAESHLLAKGLVSIARNVRFRGGEIDLVMREQSVWVIVEVRSRALGRFGGAAASVTASKRRRIVLATRLFLHRCFADRPWPACRFDLVVIDGERLEWMRNAFDGDGAAL